MILAYNGWKVAMTTMSVKLASRKLLTTSTKGALRKDMRDVSMKKVWI